jgi:hypothetical protein
VRLGRESMRVVTMRSCDGTRKEYLWVDGALLDLQDLLALLSQNKSLHLPDPVGQMQASLQMDTPYQKAPPLE